MVMLEGHGAWRFRWKRAESTQCLYCIETVYKTWVALEDLEYDIIGQPKFGP